VYRSKDGMVVKEGKSSAQLNLRSGKKGGPYFRSYLGKNSKKGKGQGGVRVFLVETSAEYELRPDP